MYNVTKKYKIHTIFGEFDDSVTDELIPCIYYYYYINILVLRVNHLHFFNFRIGVRNSCDNTITFINYGILSMTKTISLFMRIIRAYDYTTIVYVPTGFYTSEMKVLLDNNNDIFNEIRLLDLCDGNKVQDDICNLPNNIDFNLVFIGQNCVDKVYSNINYCSSYFNNIKNIIFSSQYHFRFNDLVVQPSAYVLFFIYIITISIQIVILPLQLLLII